MVLGRGRWTLVRLLTETVVAAVNAATSRKLYRSTDSRDLSFAFQAMLRRADQRRQDSPSFLQWVWDLYAPLRERVQDRRNRLSHLYFHHGSWADGPLGQGRKRNMYRGIFKGLIDRVCAGVALAVALPFLALLAVAIRSRMGSPVLFRQVRIGRDERAFGFFKFRTMTQDRDEHGKLLPDEKRLTAFGKFLRSSSLDEIPQLWNVVRGDMSLIGPRPLLPEYLSRYSDFERRRHEAKPGITGLAQVKGRNSLAWEEKFALDVQYVDRCSAGLDLRILLMTLISVVRREGISRAGHATMPEFIGSQAPGAGSK